VQHEFDDVIRAPRSRRLLPLLLGLREQCQVSVTDLAERMGWNPQNVMRPERGGNGREPAITSVNPYVRMLGFELVLATRPKKAPRTKGCRRCSGRRRG
jgi:hypothetical protein